MREKLRSKDYFELKIKNLYEGIERFIDWIQTGETPADRINIVKRAIVWDFLSIVNCKYSSGVNKENFRDDLFNAINHTIQSWDGFWKLKNNKGEEYNQYVLSAYDEMLWMLSLGYLLEIPESEFSKLVEVIDRDGVKDFLYEFIIQAKIKSRTPIFEESYKDFAMPEIFSKLRSAIKETDKSAAESLIKTYIQKNWYSGHKGAGWYNNHKSKHDSYSGYWSFETAAIVKIMGLDDSGFRDCEYYPKDLL